MDEVAAPQTWNYPKDVVILVNPAKRKTVIRTFVVLGVICVGLLAMGLQASCSDVCLAGL